MINCELTIMIDLNFFISSVTFQIFYGMGKTYPTLKQDWTISDLYFEKELSFS